MIDNGSECLPFWLGYQEEPADDNQSCVAFFIDGSTKACKINTQRHPVFTASFGHGAATRLFQHAYLIACSRVYKITICPDGFLKYLKELCKQVLPPTQGLEN